MKLFLSARRFFLLLLLHFRPSWACVNLWDKYSIWTYICLSHKSLISSWISIKFASAIFLCMLYLWNNFQPKASTWMYLMSTAIMVPNNKGNFEKVPGHNFFKFSLNIRTSIWFLYLKFYANHVFVVYAMKIINQQCRIAFVNIHKKQWYAKQKHPGCKKSARPRRSSIVNG